MHPLSSDFRTRRFNRPTFRLTRPTNHWKNTAFRDFSNISRGCIFFHLTLTLLHLLSDWLDYSTAVLCICFSTLHIVGSFYLNFLRPDICLRFFGASVSKGSSFLLGDAANSKLFDQKMEPKTLATKQRIGWNISLVNPWCRKKSIASYIDHYNLKEIWTVEPPKPLTRNQM